MNRLFLLVVSAFFTSGAFAQEAQEQILFANVHVFDGVSEMRIENANVLITDNLISAISTDPIVTDGATVIDGAGRTLMPGIIDSHIHLIVGYISAPDILTELPGYLTIRSTLAAEQVLDQGITTVRELGGESFTLKRAIDEGLMPGPRIFPSGAFITQTSGHFDFRSINSNNPSLTGSVPEFTLNQVYIVDSPDAVRAASRENLRRGASQLKLAIGGGRVVAH